MAKKAIDQPKRKRGRPSSYSQECVDEICTRIAMGEALMQICEDAHMPNIVTVYRWLQHADHEDFRNAYMRAREKQADTLADQILTISNTPVIGIKKITKGDSVEIVEGDMIEHRRLQIDARKWLAAKLRPKKYGEKVDVEHSGDVRIMMQPGDDKL